MKSGLLAILGLPLFCLVASTSGTASKPEDTVVLLHVLFRHGNRAPDTVYPNDPYANETYEPFGFSQLTPKGQKTEYTIGQYLRKTYKNLIPKSYTPNVVSSLSTNFKRTKISLELVLASLFVPTADDHFAGEPNWQPIAFNIEQASGLIGNAPLYCPNYINAYYSYIFRKEAQGIIAKYKGLYANVAKYTGARIKTPADIGNIYFTLKSEEDFGLKLPAWTNGLWPKTLEDAAAVNYEFSTSSPQLTRLTSGFLLAQILQNSFAKENGNLPEARKLFLYSAHEFNVATMLRALGVYYRHVPPFGATIFFEIHNIEGEYGLRLLYQDYQQTDPKVLTIPGCTTICPLDQVASLVQANLPGPSDTCITTGEVA